MLRKLLRLATEQGTNELTSLANALDVSPRLIREMLEEIEWRGYLEAIVPGREQACERCPLRAACLYRNRPRVWMLTRKGEQSLATSP